MVKCFDSATKLIEPASNYRNLSSWSRIWDFRQWTKSSRCLLSDVEREDMLLDFLYLVYLL